MKRDKAGRFEESGNPKGRPRKKQAAPASAFEILLDRTHTLNENGVERQLSPQDALDHQIFVAAVAGKRKAIRELLKMIKKRDEWIAGNSRKKQQFSLSTPIEHEPKNANDALRVLGIAERDTRWPDDRYDPLILQHWAVQAALSRPGGKRGGLTTKDIEEVERHTKDSKTLRWPRRMQRDENG